MRRFRVSHRNKLNHLININIFLAFKDHLCGLVVRVPGYRSRGSGSIPSATSFSEKQWVWNGVH
jgi:hypothetical protein